MICFACNDVDVLGGVDRRGYAAASHASVSARFGGGGSRSRMMGKLEERAGIKEDSGASSSWAPDPVTGYYRPINHATEIDAVELRKLLLNNKVRETTLISP